MAVFFSMTSMFAGAEELDSLYAKLLESIRQDDIACAYTRTYSSEDSDVQVESFSPDTRWSLMTVGGATPSARELEDYETEADERDRSRNAPSDLGFLSSTVFEIEQVNQDDEETIEFIFKPDLGDEFPEEMVEKLSGRLTVARNGMRPLKYMISLTEPASPMRMVKIRTFEQDVVFIEDPKTGATLIESVSFNAQGRAFAVKKIAQEERVAFSDFDCQVIATKSPGG